MKTTYIHNSSIPCLIVLDKCSKSQVHIDTLPEDLINLSVREFNNMFNLHPESRGKVIMSNYNVNTSRWHQSYLNTPEYKPDIGHSYMFSGVNPEQQPELPSIFKTFLDYLNETRKQKFNQVVANWYNDGSDYIAYHSDYTVGMPDDANIVVITFNEDDLDSREFVLKAKKDTDSIYDSYKILCKTGTIISMNNDVNKYYRHGVPKSNSTTKRISLTFRTFL